MAKSKFEKAAFRSNPTLATIREAIEEVGQIQRTLRSMEAKAARPGFDVALPILQSGLFASDLPHLNGWMLSLIESYIGIALLTSTRVNDKELVDRLTRFMQQQGQDWSVTALVVRDRGSPLGPEGLL